MSGRVSWSARLLRLGDFRLPVLGWDSFVHIILTALIESYDIYCIMVRLHYSSVYDILCYVIVHHTVDTPSEGLGFRLFLDCGSSFVFFFFFVLLLFFLFLVSCISFFFQVLDAVCFLLVCGFVLLAVGLGLAVEVWGLSRLTSSLSV